MKKNLSLNIKLPVPIIAIILLVFMLSSFIIIQREAQVAQETIITSAESFSTLSTSEIISNYEMYYDSGYYKFIEVVSDLMAVNYDCIAIQMYHVNGELLFDSKELSFEKYDKELNGIRMCNDEALLNSIVKIDQTYTKSAEDGTFEFVQPYISEWGSHEYSIRYVYSFSRLIKLEQEMILIVSFYSAVFFIISFISIFILLSHFISRPINILITGVRNIQRGRLGEKINIRSNDEMGELASSFNNMTVDLKRSQEQLEAYSRNLEKLVDQKNQLIIQLSHDLKNPLGPITNLVSLLKNMETDYSKKEMLEVLQRNADYMKNLVIKTIEYTKVNSQEPIIQKQNISLRTVIEKIISMKKSMIDEKNIVVNLDVGNEISIFADRLYFEELFTNIFENAILYNKTNGSINIKAKKEEDIVSISIIDSGVGLNQDQIGQVFNEFYKVDEARHNFESSGLGLTIAKKIVELHG